MDCMSVNQFEAPRRMIGRWAIKLLRLGYYLKFAWDRHMNRWGMLDDPMRTEFYREIWRSAAHNLSLKYVEMPGGFCEISLNGRRTRIFQNLLELDHPVTIKLARSKPLVLNLLAENGIPVPEHAEFSLGEMERGLEFLGSSPDPIVIKPSQGTAGGEGVTTNVRTRSELRSASIFASLYGHVILAERQISGESYRLLYLDGKLLDAIRRRSPSVVGDGASSIRELISEENSRRSRLRGAEGLTWLRIDADCRNTLRRAGMSPASVPAKGVEVVVKQAANDNSSRENESVTGLFCEEVVRAGAAAAEILGVRLAGVDMITTDPGLPLQETGGVINEVNTTPGLHYHYQIRNRDAGRRVVEPILQEILARDHQHHRDRQ